ncbi:MAG: hypothetical protein IBX71_04170 [Candidatus Desulforudis sp.]|nr:hypothetical protein [Desulforudis sp.]
MQDKSDDVLLGSRLVEEGIINPSQLEEVLTLNAAGDETPLGTILTRLGYCSEDDITRVMAGVLGVEFISLETYPVDKAAAAAVPAEVIKRYRVAPVGVRDGKLVLAMENPSDITVLDDLRFLTGFDIVPVMAPGSELDAAVERHSRGRLPFETGTVEETPAEYVTVVEDKASEGPAVRLANLIIAQAVDAGASDIHVEPYEHHLRIRFRIDGVLHDWLEPPRRMHASLISR